MIDVLAKLQEALQFADRATNPETADILDQLIGELTPIEDAPPGDKYLERFPPDARSYCARAYQDGYLDEDTAANDDKTLASQALEATNAAEYVGYVLALGRREHGDIAMSKAIRAAVEKTDAGDPLIKCWPDPGEPSFNLLGRDPSFSGLVDIWCDLRTWFIRIGVKPAEDMAKVIEARAIADAGRKWIAEHRPLFSPKGT